MSQRRRRTVDLVQVFTEDDIADELYGDGPRPPRDPNVPPKIFFSSVRPVTKKLHNNTPFGRAVAQTYTSDTSTEWETTDDDENEEWEPEGKSLGTGLSGDEKGDQSTTYCTCPTTGITDANEPEDLLAATTSKLKTIALDDRLCSKCMKESTPLPGSQANQECNKDVKKTKKTKYHKCQLLRVFTGYTLDPPRSQDKKKENSSADNSVKDKTEEICVEIKSVKDKSGKKCSKNHSKGKRSGNKSKKGKQKKKLAENKTETEKSEEKRSEDKLEEKCSEDATEDNSSNAEKEKMCDLLHEKDKMFNLLYEKEELEEVL